MIARLSVLKSLPVLLFLPAAMWFYWISLFASREPVAYLQDHVFWAALIVLGWICVAIFSWMIWQLAVQLLFKRGVGIWLDGRKLIYPSPRLWSVDVGDVADIALGYTERGSWGAVYEMVRQKPLRRGYYLSRDRLSLLASRSYLRTSIALTKNVVG